MQGKSPKVLKVISGKFNLQSLPDPAREQLKARVKAYCGNVAKRWIKHRRSWQKSKTDPSFLTADSLELVCYTPPTVIPNSIKRGRPVKSFADSGTRSRSEKASKSTRHSRSRDFATRIRYLEKLRNDGCFGDGIELREQNFKSPDCPKRTLCCD